MCRYRRKHNNPLIERPTVFHFFARWFLPWLGVSELEEGLLNISAIVEKTGNKTMDTISALQEEVTQLAQTTLQMALDMLLASKEGFVLY